jgi:hypothetical protein
VLKFIFWMLLSVNVLLLAYGQGLLGNFKSTEREPTRMVNQLNRNALVLITAEQASRAAPPAEEAPPPPAPVQAPAPKQVLACVEIGNVAASDVRRVESLLAPLKLDGRLTRDALPAPEVTSHIVYIPSPGGKAAAEKRVAELRELGVSNYFIMSDSPTMRYAISLGVFKSEAAAQTLLAALKRQGVADERVSPRTSQVTKTTWRLRDLDPETRAKVDAVINRLPPHTLRSCR